MKKSLTLLIICMSVFSGAAVNAADNGVTICNETDSAFFITCNSKTAPPILKNSCLPVSWNAIATNPWIFGGSQKNPLTHLTCEWNSIEGEKLVSTTMDIDPSTLNLGKVSDIVVNSDYTYTSDPNPVPSGFTPNIAVTIKHR